MAITASDIIIRLTTKTGSAGDSNSGTPAGSLGGFTSTTEMGTGAGALFDDVSGAENAASDVEYRAVDVLNNHATLTLQSAVVYISSEVSGGASVALAVDNIGPVSKSGSSQGANVADENTAPTGVGSFSSPTSAGSGLALGNIAPGQIRRVWVRRTAANSAALNNDGFTIGVDGDTAA